MNQKIKTLLFFLRRALMDVISPNRFFVSKAYKPHDVGLNKKIPYQLDYTTQGMVKYYRLGVDDEGIVMMSHYVDHNGSDTHYYSPVKIAHYALGAYNDYLKDINVENLHKFQSHLNWLVNNSTKESIGRTWRVPSTNPKYELEMNYISAISQGLVLSVLARGFVECSDTKLLEFGEEALKSLTFSVEDGGLLALTRWGPSFEEYPCVPYSHVMNGFVFCLTGLDDFHRLTGSVEAKRLFDLGLMTFRNMTSVWFDGSWARYDLRDLYTKDIPNLATRHYQYLHADQMLGMYCITEDLFYLELHRKFLRQVWNPIGFLRAYWSKLRKFV